jgi:hypothetical protein
MQFYSMPAPRTRSDIVWNLAQELEHVSVSTSDGDNVARAYPADAYGRCPQGQVEITTGLFSAQCDRCRLQIEVNNAGLDLI